MSTQHEKTVRRVYDGGALCHTKACCPVVDELEDGMVRIHDPAKPESGAFVMSRDEYNTLLANAQPVA